MYEISSNKEKFIKISNKLLNSSFLLKSKNREEYAFFEQNIKDFENLFEKIGYEIKVHNSQGIIQLLNKFEQSNKLKLKKYQSIILLLLRRIYIEKKSEVREDSEVNLTVTDLQQTYNSINDSSRKNLDITSLKDCLRLFKKYQLIDFKGSLNSMKVIDDVVIEILPTISLSLINEDFDTILKETEAVLNTYLRGESQDEIDED